jgi:alanine racemase
VTPPGRLTLDLDALADNWRRLAREVAPAACAAVIKADAYGIGVEHAAPALYRAGARIFFVAQGAEGVRARAALGPQARLYVLNGLEIGAEPGDYLAHGLAPVIGSLGEYARWDGAGPFALHVDTGMNRLGFVMADLDPLRLKGPSLLMSHLISAEDWAAPTNARQIAAFAEARTLFPGVPASLANSSGVFLPQRPHYDLVRPGYALYGGNPTPGRENPMKPVATLELSVQQVRWLDPGETAGYNGRWTARRRSRLAVLPMGYADGLPIGAGGTDATPGPEVRIAGRMCPLVGRISMDLSLADVTYLPEGAVGPGTRAEVFGPHAALDTFAGKAGTIGYNVLTGLGRRYERVVKGS